MSLPQGRDGRMMGSSFTGEQIIAPRARRRRALRRLKALKDEQAKLQRMLASRNRASAKSLYVDSMASQFVVKGLAWDSQHSRRVARVAVAARQGLHYKLRLISCDPLR